MYALLIHTYVQCVNSNIYIYIREVKAIRQNYHKYQLPDKEIRLKKIFIV